MMCKSDEMTIVVLLAWKVSEEQTFCEKTVRALSTEKVIFFQGFSP